MKYDEVVDEAGGNSQAESKSLILQEILTYMKMFSWFQFFDFVLSQITKLETNHDPSLLGSRNFTSIFLKINQFYNGCRQTTIARKGSKPWTSNEITTSEIFGQVERNKRKVVNVNINITINVTNNCKWIFFSLKLAEAVEALEALEALRGIEGEVLLKAEGLLEETITVVHHSRQV